MFIWKLLWKFLLFVDPQCQRWMLMVWHFLRVARWQHRRSLAKSIWCGSAYKVKMWNGIPPCAEEIAPIDIHLCLLNIYGDQPVDVNTLWWWYVSAVATLSAGQCRLLPVQRPLIIPSENAWLTVVTVLKKRAL